MRMEHGYDLAVGHAPKDGGAIEEVTGESTHPPQTIIGVTGLALPGLIIEIEVTALIGP